MAEQTCHVNEGSDRMNKNWVEVNSLNGRRLIFHSSGADTSKCSSLDIFLVFPAKTKSVKTEERGFLSRELLIVVVRAERILESPTQDVDRSGGSCCFPLSLKPLVLLHHLQAALCKENGQMY